MEMIKTSDLKLQKKTERRQADLTPRKQATCIEIKETLLLTSWTAVFEYSEKVGTNGTLVHEMSHSSDRTGERLPITDVKE
jgi:hypothetical protein